MPPTEAAPLRFPIPIEVRFRDTDAMGHVNNAVYLTYFEQARAGYYRAVTGRSFEGIEENPESIILAHAPGEVRSPAFFGERLVAQCRATGASRPAVGPGGS